VKKLTAIYPDDAAVDITSLVAHATEIKIESVANGKAPKKLHRDPTMSVPECVMSHFTSAGEFSIENAIDWVVKKKFAPNSAGAACSFLVKDGYLKKVAPGRFRFVKQLSGPYHRKAA